MKNLKMFGVILCGLLLLTACGGSSNENSGKADGITATMTCNQEITGEKYALNVGLAGETVKVVSATAEFASEEDATTYEQFLKHMESTYAVDMGISRTGTSITIKDYSPIVVLGSGDNEVKVDELSKDDLVKILLQQNFACE